MLHLELHKLHFAARLFIADQEVVCIHDPDSSHKTFDTLSHFIACAKVNRATLQNYAAVYPS